MAMVQDKHLQCLHCENSAQQKRLGYVSKQQAHGAAAALSGCHACSPHTGSRIRLPASCQRAPQEAAVLLHGIGLLPFLEETRFGFSDSSFWSVQSWLLWEMRRKEAG